MSGDTLSGVARQLRQEAFFGCCICGSPIIQYHHIKERSEEDHFRPEEMMVLCPQHHDQATKKALPEPEQREHKANPYNKRRNYAGGLLEVKQDYCAINMGTVFMVGEGACLRIDGEDLLKIEMGEKHLQISLRFYDEKDNLLVHIDCNEWISGEILPWDIEADWQKLIIRHKSRDIRLEHF